MISLMMINLLIGFGGQLPVLKRGAGTGQRELIN